MSQNRKRILIIDDDEDIRATLRALLTKRGYDVETAESGIVAIETSFSVPCNLALIDIMLPDMVGTELLVKLKPMVPKMRKIIITGHAALDNAVDAVNYDADAYLTKPLNPPDLLKIIDDQLKLQDDELSFEQINTQVSAVNDQVKALRGELAVLGSQMNKAYEKQNGSGKMSLTERIKSLWKS